MKVAYIFPGQGAQVVGMGKDFYEAYPESEHIFDWGEVLVNRQLKKYIFEGPTELLTETRTSQLAIFLTSVAILKVIEKELPTLKPSFVAGLSLGEYTALYAANVLSFETALPLIQQRSRLMNVACTEIQGKMAAVIGLDAKSLEECIKSLNLPNDLWIANYNCPGQYVISGTDLGVTKGSEAVKEAGARKVIPLDVHGAFHSGLMQRAQELLAPYIEEATFLTPQVEVVMNRPGKIVRDVAEIKVELLHQVTAPVKWEQSIEAIKDDVDLFVEIGPGKSLAGMNRKIGCKAPTISVSQVEDIEKLKQQVKRNG